MVVSNSYHVGYHQYRIVCVPSCYARLKLYMKNSELRSVFMSVNQSEHLSNDMVKQVSLDHMTHGDYYGNTKQLLKYYQPVRRQSYSMDTAKNTTSLQKLTGFYMKLVKFNTIRENCVFILERMGEVMPTIEAILMATKEVSHSC